MLKVGMFTSGYQEELLSIVLHGDIMVMIISSLRVQHVLRTDLKSGDINEAR